ncbi:MAG: hydrogenase maturation nickel metallochaperone HypA [Pseudomonadota bacterium]
MHEMSLAQGMVSAIEAQAASQVFERVTKVTLEIGTLSHVDPHAMEFSFDAATRGTLIEGAYLEILNPPGAAQCFACDSEVTIAKRGDGCPKCGSHQLIVTGGEDMKIKSMEVI